MREEARWTLHISPLRQKTHLNGKHIVFIILRELKEQGCHGNSHLSERERAAEGLVLGPEEWRERTEEEEKEGGEEGGGWKEDNSDEGRKSRKLTSEKVCERNWLFHWSQTVQMAC